MKVTELREMTVAELNQELLELKEQLFKLRFQHATNQLDNPLELKMVRRDIARVKQFYVNLKIAEEKKQEDRV